jgi:ATPase subunit of ABC transporter with duplicated ATPase domains
VFVSHDRAFVSALATRILEVTTEGFRDFPGTYDDYLGQRGDDHLDADAVVLRAKKQQAHVTPMKGASASLSWDEQKKRKNRQKQLPSLRDETVKAIEVAEGRKAAIHARWCEPGFFESAPPALVAALEAEEKALGLRIDALIREWEALEKEISEPVS